MSSDSPGFPWESGSGRQRVNDGKTHIGYGEGGRTFFLNICFLLHILALGTASPASNHTL